jgi:hypothetical protein
VAHRPPQDPGASPAACPTCGRDSLQATVGVERVLITLSSGARFALWHLDSRWWIRPQSTATATADEGVATESWLATTRPRPWPCSVGIPVQLGDLLGREGGAGAFELITATITDIATWQPGDLWPGEPPDGHCETIRASHLEV